ECLHGVRVAGTHGHSSYINVAVTYRFHGQVFLGGMFPAGGKFGNRSAGRGLRHLAACIGIDFCVQDEDVDVAAGAEDVIEAAEADVIGPAVATDQPDALAHEGVGHG